MAFNTFAEEPSVAYIFPAGGQRGTTVSFRVGGHFLHGDAGFEMLGSGVVATSRVRETNTIWFEGPMIVQPASQGKEDYPRDHAGSVQIAATAELGTRHWRVWTSQGATPAMKFIVSDLPEIIEQEQDGGPIPVEVKPPVTINGRIFPRENVDVWTFAARAGQEFTCQVAAQSFGSPLQARIAVLNASGHEIAEAVATSRADPQLHFRAPADGHYAVKIHDVNFAGLQQYVYRLTITSEPVVNSFFPLGGRRGETVKLELSGAALPASSVEIKIPENAPNTFFTPLVVAGQTLHPGLLEVDDLPEFVERGETFTPPAILNGRIAKPGQTNEWSFIATKNAALEFTLAAARLGSPLTPVLTISDADGKALARAEASFADISNTTLAFKAPTDGTYFVRVADHFASRGGAAFAYRLRVASPAEPDFRLTFTTDALNVLRDLPDGLVVDTTKKTKSRQKPGQLKLNVISLNGFTGEINLAVENIPALVTVTNTKIAAKKLTHELTFAAEPLAKIGATQITIRGTATLNGQSITRTATLPLRRGEMPVDTVLLAVALPTPFKVGGEYSMALASRGTHYTKHYSIERGGFTGELRVRLADRQGRHLQGVTGSEIIISPAAEVFDYTIQLPPWMEMGRTSRSALGTFGVIHDHDGSEHMVSYSSNEQNDQIIAVIEAGRLDVETSAHSLAVTPGKTTTLDFRIQRDPSLASEAVRVELLVPPSIKGVQCESQTIPAAASAGALLVKIANATKPFQHSFIVRATTLNAKQPHIAEQKLTLTFSPPERVTANTGESSRGN